MAREIGKVVKINDDGIDIKIPTGEGCLSCSAKSACNFSGPASAYRSLTLPYQMDIQVGDMVTIEYQDSAQNLSALIIFGSPILLFLISYLLIKNYFKIPNGEIWAIGITVILYVITIIFSNRLFAHSPNFQPKIINIQKSGTGGIGEMKSFKINH
jgi:positive regulator of sigma E activity